MTQPEATNSPAPANAIEDAKIHLEEAIRLLTLRAFRIEDGKETPDNNMCNITEELDRVDHAIGPKGESMFAKLGDTALRAFVEIKAARAALTDKREGQP